MLPPTQDSLSFSERDLVALFEPIGRPNSKRRITSHRGAISEARERKGR